LPQKHSLKVLVIGSGGREHALCWKLAQSPEVETLYSAPANPGIAQVARCLETSDYLAAADSINADLTVVGPEAPLAAGIVDQFRERGRAIVGPTAAAARLEASKAFAKDFMMRAGIPTARFITVDTVQQAHTEVRNFEYPVVLKADGLAAGKGVIIAHSSVEAEAAIEQLLTPGSRLVIEEFLEGEEVSFIVLSDGANFVPLDPAQDHKAIFDGDNGPNTGGMGAYCDGRILTPSERKLVTERAIRPAIDAMRQDGEPFTGFLYAGLMMTKRGPQVLEFNARLGDPETQVLMHRMRSDFVPFLWAAANGELESAELEWQSEPSVCVVLAASGYPGTVRTGDAITGLDAVQQANVFQAGTKLNENVLTTSGGRVLGVTASGPDLATAINTTYDEVQKIHFDGMQYRRDIGRKGLKRW
jgi:phosphoribosylamine--glycine ligase